MSLRINPYDGRRSPRHRSWDAPSILLAIAVMASPLLIGGVHATSAAAVAAVALMGLWWSIVGGHDSSETTELWVLSIPALGCALMALICLVQLTVIPTGVYRLVQPVGHEQLVESWSVVFGESFESGWHLLSLDPRQTAAQGVRWVALAAIAALAARVSVGRRRRRKWLGFIAITGVVVALLGIAQYLSGTDKMMWWYEAQIAPRSMSPFVSTNHAATYFALIAIVAVAFSCDQVRRSPLKTSLGALVGAGAIVLCAAHGSDGALGALAVAVAVIAVMVVTRASPEHNDSTGRWRFATVVTLAVFFVAAIGATLMPDEWTLADDETLLDHGSAEVRLHMAGAALKGAPDFAVLGSGAGSVERVLPPYLDWHYVGPSTIPTIENEPIEWAMTLGPLVALMAFALWGVIAFRTGPHVVRRRGRRGASVAFALTLFLGIIALFHFPFMTLGISAVALVAIECCLDPRRDRLYLQGSRRAMLCFALGLTTALAGLMVARATVLSPGAEADLQVDDPAQVRRAIQRYPTDGVLISALSFEARAQERHDRAVTLARRAFELRPHPQQEFLLASSLANADQRPEAAAVYHSLLRAERRRSTGLYRWVAPRILTDLPRAEWRAKAFADASDSNVARIRRRIEDEESVMAAIDFALALVDERPDRAHAHLTLIQLYHNAGQDELAEMYARMLIARNLAGDDGARPAGLFFLLDLLRNQDRHSEARLIADRAFETGYATPALGRAVLELMPEDPADDNAAAYRHLFEAAQSVGCRPPYERAHRALCWRTRAYFSELDDEVERAAGYLRRIERLDGDPRPLASLYARHGKCRELAGLRREYEEHGYQRSLREAAARCARQSD